MAKRLRKETAAQQRAFEMYYGLGFARSYRAVAKELGVSVATVKLWGGSFTWRKRVGERDLEVARTVSDRTIKGEAETKERQVQIVRMAMIHVAKAIAEAKVKVTIGDLDRLIRLERFLANEPDSRTEHVIGDLSGRTQEELRAMLAQEMEMARRLRPAAARKQKGRKLNKNAGRKS